MEIINYKFSHDNNKQIYDVSYYERTKYNIVYHGFTHAYFTQDGSIKLRLFYKHGTRIGLELEGRDTRWK